MFLCIIPKCSEIAVTYFIHLKFTKDYFIPTRHTIGRGNELGWWVFLVVVSWGGVRHKGPADGHDIVLNLRFTTAPFRPKVKQKAMKWIYRSKILENIDHLRNTHF